jgi:hypothetical protein
VTAFWSLPGAAAAAATGTAAPAGALIWAPAALDRSATASQSLPGATAAVTARAAVADPAAALECTDWMRLPQGIGLPAAARAYITNTPHSSTPLGPPALLDRAASQCSQLHVALIG